MADEKKAEEKKEKGEDEAKKAAPAKEEKGGKKEEKKEEKKDAKEEKKEGEEAPAEGAEGEAPAEGKKKIPKKVLIIAAAAGGAVVLIGIIVAVLFMTGILGGKPGADVHAADTAAKDVMTGAAPKGAHGGGHGDGKDKGKEGGGAVFYDLGEMIVNLNTDGKRQTFLKLVVQLELESVEDKLVIDGMKPRIVDNFQTYLRELRVDDLRGSAGLYRLREELLFRVTEAVHPIKIRDVLFQQMLVQ